MKIFRQTLGGTYGGPSISYEGGEFVLYEWTDAPSSETILVRGATWSEFLENLRRYRREKTA